MKKIVVFYCLIFCPLAAFAKHYRFTIKDVQDTVRSALIKADAEINLLAASGELSDVAYFYFQTYLDQIGSYNQSMPKTVNLVEAYKTELVNAFVLKEFKETFQNLIYDKSKWMFNNVGGIYANMIILHCSLHEYLVLWGTTLPAENKFSGYYPFMNEFDVMVRGEMYSHDLDSTGHVAVKYRPFIQDGVQAATVDTSNLIPGNERVYNLKHNTYMVSYAQGNIVRAFMPGAIMPGIFVNQDWFGLRAHIKESYRAFSHIKKKHHKENKGDKDDWKVGRNYRAIWIIDDYRKSFPDRVG